MSEDPVDRAALERSLDALAIPREGLFGPGSFAWRMFRERALVTYAPRAVMLQYAYPPFAAASASYGAHAKDPGARFERAVSTLLAMIFGDRDRVMREARRLFLLHDRLHANGRESLTWVLVTLVDASVRGFERHVGAIDEHALFAELPRFAALFGLAPSELPRSRAELDARVDGEALVLGEEARAMWAFLGRGARMWAAATLPAPLRAELFPCMSEGQARAIERAGSALRAACLPPRLRYVEAYVAARDRVRA